MKALFASNWDEQYSVFENISNLTAGLSLQASAYEGYYRELVLRKISEICELRDRYDFGYLTAEETEEAIAERIRELTYYMNQEPVKEEDEDWSDEECKIIPFPTYRIRLSPKMQAYQHYLNFEILKD